MMSFSESSCGNLFCIGFPVGCWEGEERMANVLEQDMCQCFTVYVVSIYG